jgi:hypothetical protein
MRSQQVQSAFSGRSWAPWVFLGAIVFLVESGLPVRAQTPAAGNADAMLETWREYGSNAAAKAKTVAATLTPARHNEARSLFASAFDLTKEGKLDAAKIAFERGLTIDPSDGMAEYYLADTLVKMKQVNDALPHYATAMGLAPNSKQGIEAEAALRELLPSIVAARAAAKAQAVQAETVLWQAAQSSGTVPDYRAYLRRYPNGMYAPLATARIDALNAETDRKQQAAAEEQRRVAAITAEARRQEGKNHLQCSFSMTENGISTGIVPIPGYPQLYIDVIGAQHVRLTDGAGTRDIVSGQPDPQDHDAPWTVSVTDDLIDYSSQHTQRNTVVEQMASFQTTIQRQTGQFTQVITSKATWLIASQGTENHQFVFAGTCTPKQ